ncbi:MAG: sugar phosphate isomerase/epimerase family protein [Thermodesulfobacteriota bacterium]
MNIREIAGHCFINAPFDFLRNHLEEALEMGIQPEIGLEGNTLYDISTREFSRVARRLHDNGIACTLHAPYYELSVGAIDRHIREVSRKKISLAFELLEIFKPESIVCHLGFEENKHGYKEEEWFHYNLEAWQQLVKQAERNNTPVMLENTYETSPEQHKKILAAIDSPYARFCLDTGHLMAFARDKWQNWLPEMEPWLGQLHLHDNHGLRDDHLPMGKGKFDFKGFFAWLRKNEASPLITLEPHRKSDLEESLLALDHYYIQPDKTI